MIIKFKETKHIFNDLKEFKNNFITDLFLATKMFLWKIQAITTVILSLFQTALGKYS